MQPTVTVGEATAFLKGEDFKASWSGLVGQEQMYLFLVADGHGGAAAARHCARTALRDHLR